jgi:NAD(P)H-flavin reductase
MFTENQIIEKKLLAPAIVLFKIYHPLIANKAKAGQFVIVLKDDTSERIPLTLAKFFPKEGLITLVIQEIGYSTKMLSEMKKGEVIKHIAGPLGTPSEIDSYGKIVCIGGGVGVAPVYPIAKELNGKNNEVISILGAKSKNFIIMRSDFEPISKQLMITTDDGSEGIKGFVTDALKNILDKENIVRIIAIGPLIMMKNVCELSRSYKIKTVVSLNPVMIDGTGMCGGCRVSVDGKTRFTCTEGPEFDGHKVDFNELMLRQTVYREEEQHRCKLDNRA